MEVLAASAVVAVGMTAMASLSGTLMLQEELGWRVSVVRNYQENMARVWQLGIDSTKVMTIMPSQTDNTVLNQIINGNPSVTKLLPNVSTSLGSMETALVTATVNISQDPKSEASNPPLTFRVFRPSLPTDIRSVLP